MEKPSRPIPKRKKKVQSGSGAPEVNWPYFKSMLFYVKFTKPRKTYTNTPKKAAVEQCQPGSSASVWSEVESIITPPEDTNNGIAVSETPKTTPRPTASTSINKRKRPEVQPDITDVLNMAKSLCTTIESRTAVQMTNNPNKTFVDYLFSELEKLPEKEAKNKRKNILDIFFND